MRMSSQSFSVSEICNDPEISHRIRTPPGRPHSFAREFGRIRSSRIRSENETASLVDARPRGRLSVRFSFVCHACPSGLVCVSRLWCVHLVSCASSSVRTAELRSRRTATRAALRSPRFFFVYFESCVYVFSSLCCSGARHVQASIFLYVQYWARASPVSQLSVDCTVLTLLSLGIWVVT